MTVWLREFGAWDLGSHFPVDGTPYQAESPTLYKRITFTPDEIWREVARLDKERGRSQTLGMLLFYNIGLFANGLFFIDEWTDRMLDDFIACQTCGVPLAASLDDLPVFRSEAFVVIQSEATAAARVRMEKERKRGR